MPGPWRIQSYLRASAARRTEGVSRPPFSLFFHPTDPLPAFNYAIPDRPFAPDEPAGPALWALRSEFGLRRRAPRIEFVEECAPGLEATLAAAGFRLEARALLMSCGRGDLVLPPAVPGLTWCILSEASGLPDLRLFLQIQREAFGVPGRRPVTEADARWLRHALGRGRAFLGFLEGGPAATALFTDPLDDLAEVAGVATLPALRGRGLGSTLAAEAACGAFGAGARSVFLATSDDRAGHLYARLGFRPCGSSLSFQLGEGARDESL